MGKWFWILVFGQKANYKEHWHTKSFVIRIDENRFQRSNYLKAENSICSWTSWKQRGKRMKKHLRWRETLLRKSIWVESENPCPPQQTLLFYHPAHFISKLPPSFYKSCISFRSWFFLSWFDNIALALIQVVSRFLQMTGLTHRQLGFITASKVSLSRDKIVFTLVPLHKFKLPRQAFSQFWNIWKE